MITPSRCLIWLSVSAVMVLFRYFPLSTSQAFPVFPAGFVHETLISDGLDLPTAMAFGP
jgi:hypothetical protein